MYALLAEGKLFEDEHANTPDRSTLVSSSNAKSTVQYLYYRHNTIQNISNGLQVLSEQSTRRTVLAILIFTASTMMASLFPEARTHCLGLAQIFAQPHLRLWCPDHLFRDAVVVDCIISLIMQQVPAIRGVPLPKGPSRAFTVFQVKEPRFQAPFSSAVERVLGLSSAIALRDVSQVLVYYDSILVGKFKRNDDDTVFVRVLGWNAARWVLEELYGTASRCAGGPLQEAFCHALLIYEQYDLSRSSPIIQILVGRLRAAMTRMEPDLAHGQEVADITLFLLFTGCEGTIPGTELRQWFIEKIAQALNSREKLSWGILRCVLQEIAFLSTARIRTFAELLAETRSSTKSDMS